MRRILFALCLLVSLAGCSDSANQNTAPQRLEPTAAESRLLRLRGIPNPYSRRGQSELRTMRKHRAQMRKLQEERAAAREQQRNQTR